MFDHLESIQVFLFSKFNKRLSVRRGFLVLCQRLKNRFQLILKQFLAIFIRLILQLINVYLFI